MILNFVLYPMCYNIDDEVMERLYEFSAGQAHNTVLVVDGAVLTRLVVPGTEKERAFITIAGIRTSKQKTI